MPFTGASSFGYNLICQLCRSSLHLGRTNLNARTLTSKANFKDEDLLLFFDSKVQNILKKMTGLDFNEVFSNRKLEEKLEPPKYKFMTSEQVQEATEKARQVAEEMIQMPPVVPVRKEIDVVISEDPELIGLSESKFIFTDISFGKSDRTRTIVVRDPNGTLRRAYWSERRNANQTYFPRPGRQYKIPKMFQPEYLKRVLERRDYIFILDRACVEFDADDPEYHRVTQATYDDIEEKQEYGILRFSRHFGPMVFYLVLHKTIDNLLIENLKTNRLDDAVSLVTLYNLVHPTAKSAGSECQHGQEINFIKEYIEKESKQKVALELAVIALIDAGRPQQKSASSN